MGSPSPLPATLRPATEPDLPAVLGLWTDAGSVPTVSDSLPALRVLREYDPGALLLAEAEGEIVGTLLVTWDGWRGGLWRLAVAPGHRRRGIARALVRAGEERLRSLGAQRISVILDAAADDALAFWDAVGYAREPHRLRAVRDLG